MEVIYFKYGLSVGQIVLLKVVIKTAARRSVGEIRLEKSLNHLTGGLEDNSLYLKSGIPLGVLMPAPAITTILLNLRSLIFSAMSFRVCW